MLNYKDCNIKDFNEAMKQKDVEVKNISNVHLYILYTKFKADAATCFYAKTSYASGLGISSEHRANLYKKELLNRGIMVV